jgi:hypothetical protein
MTSIIARFGAGVAILRATGHPDHVRVRRHQREQLVAGGVANARNQRLDVRVRLGQLARAANAGMDGGGGDFFDCFPERSAGKPMSCTMDELG